MSNDFLSSLSSRALQNPEVDSVAGGLKPRLASRFETPTAPMMPSPDQAPEIEAFMEVETAQKTTTRKIAREPEQDQPEAAYILSLPNEQTQSRISISPRLRSDEGTRFLEGDPSQATPSHVKPIIAEGRSEPSTFRLEQGSAEQLGSTAPSERNGTNLQPEVSPESHQVSPRSEPQQRSEPHRARWQPIPSFDPKSVMPVMSTPAALPVNQTKVVPAHIEVNRMEPRLQSPGIPSQIIPALRVPKLRPQTKAPEASVQPPTIHVTIGRIEVKAESANPVPKRRTPASAVMSLDEYLRWRQGGQR